MATAAVPGRIRPAPHQPDKAQLFSWGSSWGMMPAMHYQTTPPTSARAISVSELNRQVRSLLENSFLLINVEGEISNFVRPSSGHWYFTLKDEQAQVRCAMFRNRNQYLKYQPRNGDHVILRARVSLYEGRGDYQLIGEFIEESGSGALQQAYERLKAQLQQEGLFDSRFKQPLPAHPRHIGIITSPSGAAIHDILTVLKRRFPGLPVSLYPTAVQGAEAAGQICRAIALANRHAACDVLIVGRGGGSLEDLWPFNEESVARAIFASAIPVVSAVGHETDVVISDFVADCRAPTPSAAAEMLSPDQHQLRLRLGQLEQRLLQQMRQRLERRHEQLRHLRRRLRHPGERLRQQAQRLDELELRLRHSLRRQLETRRTRLQFLQARLDNLNPARQLQRHQTQLTQLQQRLQHGIQAQLQRHRLQLQHSAGRLHTVSPLATLERGYAIVQDQAGSVIHDSNQVSVGQPLEARLHRGRLRCTVDAVIQEEA